MQPGLQGLARTNHRIRSVAFAYAGLVLALLLWQRGAGPVAWALMLAQFFVYPHVLYLRAKLSARPTRAELQNLFVDAALLGAWCAELGFPTWITYSFVGATALNAVVNRGMLGAGGSLACTVAGAALWAAVRDVPYTPATSDLITGLCISGTVGYTCMVGWVVYQQSRHLSSARDALRASEERYRLIAENVGDLIALVDTEGRWLYTSPSYERVFGPADLGPGGDAFARVHPDDASRARIALARAAATHRAREVALRLVDREGRVRRYQTRIQPIEAAGPVRRLLLVSQDVTDLKESEERLLVAAHAFEGMTEAIVITSADGTVVTVNKAFCDLTGYSRDDVLGQSEQAIRNALQPAEFYDQVRQAVERDGYWSGTTWARKKNGAVYREWRSVRAVKDPAGAATHYVHVSYEAGTGADRTLQRGAE